MFDGGPNDFGECGDGVGLVLRYAVRVHVKNAIGRRRRMSELRCSGKIAFGRGAVLEKVSSVRAGVFGASTYVYNIDDLRDRGSIRLGKRGCHIRRHRVLDRDVNVFVSDLGYFMYLRETL